jgi:NAD+ kinase
MIKNVYIRTRPGEDTAIHDSLLVDVSDAIRNAGLYLIRDKDEINENTLVLALGGDGTMLSAMHIAASNGAFVTGFNYGNLGYLVPDAAKSGAQLTSKLKGLLYDINQPDDSEDDDFPEVIGGYKITKYKLPLLTWKRPGFPENAAINDFYFVPAANGSAADFTVKIGKDSSHFTTKSSGMVVSTPFGSTGLALSAGGAILSPNSSVLEVVPMLPHTLTSRPIIVPNTDSIAVSWDRRIQIFADGRLIDDFGEGSVTIKCRKRKISIVQPQGWDFFENLKNKMKWHS